MNIARLLAPEIQEFIHQHGNDDVTRLLLRAHLYPGMPVPDIARQIQARQKAKQKLPLWHKTDGIIYPISLSMEQSSSEQTAQFKASLVGGTHLVDLTGGFGVDSFYFSLGFDRVDYVEQNAELEEIARHNAKVLGRTNIAFYNDTAESFLRQLSGKADCIYLDPARRDDANRKIVRLEDCQPNVVELLPVLWQKAQNILIKTSPMLDIDLALSQLGAVSKVIVVAVDNECKEVLYLLDESKKNSEIQTINFTNNRPPQQFSFSRDAEGSLEVSYELPKAWIYEPNAAVLKAGAFQSVAERFGIGKLHRHTHLYTSDTLHEDFPGRIFQLRGICKYDKKELHRHLPEGKANIGVRNFPDGVAQIRKKTGIKEGGDQYVFAATDKEERKIMLITTKWSKGQ